jgi:hypothetical protein
MYMKVFGAFRVSVKVILMLNSTMQIDGGISTAVSASIFEVRNLATLRVNGLYHNSSCVVFFITEPYFVLCGSECSL